MNLAELAGQVLAAAKAVPTALASTHTGDAEQWLRLLQKAQSMPRCESSPAGATPGFVENWLGQLIPGILRAAGGNTADLQEVLQALSEDLRAGSPGLVQALQSGRELLENLQTFFEIVSTLVDALWAAGSLVQDLHCFASVTGCAIQALVC